MLSPIKWIKPRLKSLCVAFGAADMTLVVLSSLCWYFVFDSAFEAQHIQSLYRSHHKEETINNNNNNDDNEDDKDGLKKFKEDRTAEDLRLERTIRACGYIADEKNLLNDAIEDSNYAGPAALVGAAMGSFFILGALLASLSIVNHPAARRVICAVSLLGQGVSCFFLFIGVAVLSTNDGLCRTEYYYESFQPIFYLFVLTLIFIFIYKIYEVTIIAFYMGEQSTEADKEQKEVNNIRRSGGAPGALGYEPKKSKPPPPPQQPPPRPPSDRGAQGDVQDQNQHKVKRHSRDSHDTAGRSEMGSNDHPRAQRSRHFRQVPDEAHSYHYDGSEQRRHSVNNESEQRRKRLSKAPNRPDHEVDSKVIDRYGDGGGGDDDEKRRSSKKHHHHPLHPTKPKQPAKPAPKSASVTDNSIDVFT